MIEIILQNLTNKPIKTSFLDITKKKEDYSGVDVSCKVDGKPFDYNKILEVASVNPLKCIFNYCTRKNIYYSNHINLAHAKFRKGALFVLTFQSLVYIRLKKNEVLIFSITPIKL